MLSWLTWRPSKPHGPITELEAYAATTETLRPLLPVCPTCLGPIANHHYGQYAVAAGKADMSALLAASEESRWRDLRAIQTFNGDQDAVVALAIRCTDRSGALICALDPFELYAGMSLLRRYSLRSSEWMELLEAAPDLRWHPF